MATGRTNCRPLVPASKNVVVKTSSAAASDLNSATRSKLPVPNNQRGLKLRPANSSLLPVLCVYSDRNQLVRKEQFRPPTSVNKTGKNNNENVLQPPPPSFRSTSGHLKSTISSTARATTAATASHSNNVSNGAKRSRMTVPHSATAASISKVCPPTSNHKGKKEIFVFLSLFPKVVSIPRR